MAQHAQCQEGRSGGQAGRVRTGCTRFAWRSRAQRAQALPRTPAGRAVFRKTSQNGQGSKPSSASPKAPAALLHRRRLINALLLAALGATITLAYVLAIKPPPRKIPSEPEASPGGLRQGQEPSQGGTSARPGQGGGRASERARRKVFMGSRTIQEDYWTHNAQEKAELLARRGGLSWPEKLRLLHLAAMELLLSDAGRAAMNDMVLVEGSAPPEGLALDLYGELAAELLSAASPYRVRNGMVWLGLQGHGEKREPSLKGPIRNASLTHLGSLEVIRLDEAGLPRELAFVAMDDIRGAAFGPAALYRYARIFYDDGRAPETVLLPLLYGMSWSSREPLFRTGSATRFVFSIRPSDTHPPMGIGLGQQRLWGHGRHPGPKQTTVPLASVDALLTALEVGDPRLLLKSKARGIDPDAVSGAAGKR